MEFIPLDLADQQSIESFVKAIKYDCVDILVNNAGIMGVETLKKTKSGFEMQYGINYQGHFYLTYLLWEKLKKS